MKLDSARLSAQLMKQIGFSTIDRINESTFRAIRKFGELPFAVYYFDLNQDIPETQERLNKYLDQVIGSRYFEGSKSLQWSNYLYFITSIERLKSGELRQAKELIEHDRNYARKFVISEEDLDSILKPPMVLPSDITPQVSILSVWTDILTKAGLDNAILNDANLPSRLEIIENSIFQLEKNKKIQKSIEKVSAAPFLDSLQLIKYRTYPLLRKFDFGTVNLIFGANGSGKTSLLEAIELFYCGKNKRDYYNNIQPYEMKVGLADGREELVTNKRSQKIFRDLNLTWYGQPEIKKNGMCLSFSQFNFLDTDAAVSLAESTTRIEDDLSKLLVGPDASKTWQDIVRVNSAVEEKLHEYRSSESQFKNELNVLNLILKESNNLKIESDSINTYLNKMIHRLDWTILEKDKETFNHSIIASLSELESLLKQAVSLDWIKSPVSIYGLKNYISKSKIIEEKAEVINIDIELLHKNEIRIENKLKHDQEAYKLVLQAKRFIDAGLPIRIEEFNSMQNIIAKYSGLLAGYNDNAFSILSPEEKEVVLVSYYRDTIKKLSSADALLAETKNQLEVFNNVRDQSLSLYQELRETAARIIQSSHNPDKCPLCQTQFKQNELLKSINKSVNQDLEIVGQALLTQLRERQASIDNINDIIAKLSWLLKYCEKVRIFTGESIHFVIRDIKKKRLTLLEAQNRKMILSKELLAIQLHGFSEKSWEEILSQLCKLNYPIKDFSHESITTNILKIEQELKNSSNELEDQRKEANKFKQLFDATIRPVADSDMDPKVALALMKERCTTAETLLKKLVVFSESFPWPSKKPLAELVVETEAVHNVSNEFEEALAKEKQAMATQGNIIERKEQLINKITQLSPRIYRLNEAKTTLDTIISEYSLVGAMEAVLKKNRAGIETIFSRIHSPNEFCRLGPNLATLIRKGENTEASLNQISTGQRAAFALSIFLAQNAQLKFAPPVILIDDPIAHIDDLNSLSFLDYLREVVLTGKRQLFFATANEKIASLFERKFDFLGPKAFQRFNLPRLR